MSNSVNEILRFKKAIEEKIRYDFLWKNIQKPVIEEDKLFILSNLVPINSALSHTKRDAYIVTTMLVQIALDTHELVNESKADESTEENLSRQLHVLAGDYYSGLYYYLLSQIDEFDFIHKLASAIKAINELKMKLYYQEFASLNEYIDLKVQINTLLLKTVAAYFKHDEFVDNITQWFYISTLQKEKERVMADEIVLNSLLDVKRSNTYMNKEDKFRYILHKEWLTLQQGLKQLPHSSGEIYNYFNQRRADHVAMKASNVEEG